MTAIPYGYVDAFAPAPSTLRHAAQREAEAALIERAIAGDSEAFDAIYDRYRTDIYNFVFRFMGSHADADDLTQDAFVKAWLAICRGQLQRGADGQIRVGPWLYRIANNVCLDTLRHRRLLSWQPWEVYLSNFHPSQVAPDSPEREALREEGRREVRAVLDAMPPHYARLLELREFRDLSYHEMAAATGFTWSAVKSMLFRARDHFVHTAARMGVTPFGRNPEDAPVRRLGGVRGAR